MDAQASVLSFICASIPRFHDAEDVLQEVAIEIADHFDQYDETRPFIGWAIGIARFKIAAYFRKHSREEALLGGALLARVADAHIAQHTQLDERRRFLEECLDELPSKSRSAIIMRYGDEASSEVIAEKIGSTEGSVRVLLTRTRVRLLDCVRAKLAAEDHA